MIKIDIKMPKDCSSCRFSTLEEYNLEWYCDFLDLKVNYKEGQKLENCPLIEVEK